MFLSVTENNIFLNCQYIQVPCFVDRDAYPLFLPAIIQFPEFAFTSYSISSCQNQKQNCGIKQNKVRVLENHTIFIRIQDWNNSTDTIYLTKFPLLFLQRKYRDRGMQHVDIIFCWFGLTFCLETPSSFKSFNLSTLHCILTSCPTLSPSEGRGRKPTARHGSSTGLCKVIALLKINSCLAPSTPVDSFMAGGWAPIVLSPEIPYLIFTMLSGCFLASAFLFWKIKSAY